MINDELKHKTKRLTASLCNRGSTIATSYLKVVKTASIETKDVNNAKSPKFCGLYSLAKIGDIKTGIA